MKKALALVTLFIGSAAVIFGLAVLNLFMFFVILGFGVLLGIAAVVGLGFAHAALQGVFERKTGLTWGRYMLLAYLPSAAVSNVYFVVVIRLNKAGYFKGFAASLWEVLKGLSWSITSGAALVVGALILWLMSRRRKKEVLALIALIIGSAAAIYVLTIFSLWAFLVLFEFGVLLGIAAVIGLGFAHAALQGVFERKTGLTWVRYMLLAYLPSIVLSGVYFIIIQVSYWTITSVAAFAVGALILWFRSKKD